MFKSRKKKMICNRLIKINGKPRLKNGRQHFIRIEVVNEVLGQSSILITKKIYAQFDKESVIVGFL